MSVGIYFLYIDHNKYGLKEADWSNFGLSSACRSRARIHLILKFIVQLLNKYPSQDYDIGIILIEI